MTAALATCGAVAAPRGCTTRYAHVVSIRTYLLTGAAAAMIDELHHLAEQTIG